MKFWRGLRLAKKMFDFMFFEEGEPTLMDGMPKKRFTSLKATIGY